jgi:hypothetical protein
MEITELINHPEKMDRNTLYELRSTLAQYPYFQTARLLMLQNLYILHDASFDEELRKSAVYITNRKTIFNIVEAAHYQLKGNSQQEGKNKTENNSSRTVTLIDTFLNSIPEEENNEKKTRKPTPADAAVDYVAYLLQTENGNEEDEKPTMKGQDLIDTFLKQENGRILLNKLTNDDTQPEVSSEQNDTEQKDDSEEEYFTETLARIYIRQGRYNKALEIIGRLSRKYPQKNTYFADQMRFLEKLIINSKNTSKTVN